MVAPAAAVVAVVSAVGEVEVCSNSSFARDRDRNQRAHANIAPLPPGRGGYQQRDMGPPATVLEMGKFIHACEGEMVCESINPKIPQFNAPIYLENKVRHSPPPSHFLGHFN